MSYLSEVTAALNRQLPLWIRGRVVPRGVVLPLDPYLHGVARCAKKLGDTMAVAVPNNATKLARAVSKRDMEIVLAENTLDYLQPGYTLSLAGRQTFVVGSITGTTITMAYDNNRADEDQGSIIDLDADSPVFVYGIPGIVVSAAGKGDSTLQVKMPYPMTRGDVLSIPTKLSGIYREYAVTEILSERTVNEDEHPYYYQVRVEALLPDPTIPSSLSVANANILQPEGWQGLYRDLEDSERIYLRAFPAYFSPLIPIYNTYPSMTGALGPYMLDCIHGLVADNPAGENKYLEEYLNLRLFAVGSTGQELINEVRLRPDIPTAGSNDLQSSQYPIWGVPIEAEHMVLWEVDSGKGIQGKAGSLQLERRHLLMTPGDRGYIRIQKELVPEPGSFGEELPIYHVRAFASAPFRLVFDFYPNTLLTLDAELKNDGYYWIDAVLRLDAAKTPPRGLKITAKADPDTTIYLHTLNTVNRAISHVQYSVLAKTTGLYHWATSGLLMKPLFLTALLTDAYGQQVKADSGQVLFGPSGNIVAPPVTEPFFATVTAVLGNSTSATQTVFTDISVFGGARPYLSWDIDWGDGSPHSNIPDDTHVYPRLEGADSEYIVTVHIVDANREVTVATTSATIPKQVEGPKIGKSDWLYRLVFAETNFVP